MGKEEGNEAVPYAEGERHRRIAVEGAFDDTGRNMQTALRERSVITLRNLLLEKVSYARVAGEAVTWPELLARVCNLEGRVRSTWWVERGKYACHTLSQGTSQRDKV
jgi:hypothetical protein